MTKHSISLKTESFLPYHTLSQFWGDYRNILHNLPLEKMWVLVDCLKPDICCVENFSNIKQLRCNHNQNCFRQSSQSTVGTSAGISPMLLPSVHCSSLLPCSLTVPSSIRYQNIIILKPFYGYSSVLTLGMQCASGYKVRNYYTYIRHTSSVC